MNLKPVRDRIVVRLTEAETVSRGGIVIPDAAAEKPSQGEVLAVGPGKTLDNGTVKALGVKVGDKVVFGKYSGNEIKIDGQKLFRAIYRTTCLAGRKNRQRIISC